MQGQPRRVDEKDDNASLSAAEKRIRQFVRLGFMTRFKELVMSKYSTDQGGKLPEVFHLYCNQCE